MKILILLGLLLICGCTTINGVGWIEDKTYTLVSNPPFIHPTYYNMKQRINYREYRILPSYQQAFYEEKI